MRTVDELGRLIESLAEELFPIEYSGIYFVDPGTGRLKLVYAKGLTEAERRSAVLDSTTVRAAASARSERNAVPTSILRVAGAKERLAWRNARLVDSCSEADATTESRRERVRSVRLGRTARGRPNI